MVGNVQDHGVKQKTPDAVYSTVFTLAKCWTRDAYKKALQKLELMDEEVANCFDKWKEHFAAYLFLQAEQPWYRKQLNNAVEQMNSTIEDL
jgi:hypothetical protein